MLEPYRDRFNANYSAVSYAELLAKLNTATRSKVDFRVCETPCFFSRELLEEMAETGRALTAQLVGNPGYMRASDASVPERYRVPRENPVPNFMTVDFGLSRGEDAQGRPKLVPKLVEMQAFPSLFGYQDLLARQYMESYGLPPELKWHLGGHDDRSYWELLGRVILNGHAPENVILAEVEPDSQKTLPDFHVYEDRLGISTVDIAAIRKQGRRLFYQRDGRLTPIARIFNRAIVDEMQRKHVQLDFDYCDDLDVEWAGHPNWFFRVSKFSLPYLDHPAVPSAVFLDDWFAGRRPDRLPTDRDRLLLKPLYSFAGKGIEFAPSNELLAAVPESERHDYLLQERIDFTPVIATPHGMTQAEIRIMYLWPDAKLPSLGAPTSNAMEPVIALVRMGRGKMMGVDQNRNQEWVGGSAALFPGG
jgi:hypothetical protein